MNRQNKKNYRPDGIPRQHRNRKYYPLPGTLQGVVVGTPPDYTDINLDTAAKCVRGDIEHNKESLRDTLVCGCISCLNFFPPQRIYRFAVVGHPDAEWNRDTAICPYCGMPSVLADYEGWPMSAPFLLAMRERLYPALKHYTDPNTRIYIDSNEEEMEFWRRCNEEESYE